MSTSPFLVGLLIAGICAGCASGSGQPSYPAFIDAEELPDIFMATLPGVRAKQFVGDSRSSRTSNRIDLPPGWQGTTGGTPGRALEIFVLAGDFRLAGVDLGNGGYAYVPPGSLGLTLRTGDGARILYFLGNPATDSMIQTPLILDSRLVEWEATDIIGVLIKVLRDDPGSGARTWLMRVEPGAQLPWQSSSALREGYLVTGQFQDSECVAGEAYTDTYGPGGYFHRPPGAVNGGPEAAALSESTWYLRESRNGTTTTVDGCELSSN